MRYIAITIWQNAFKERVADIISDENSYRPRYFNSLKEIAETINPRFPGDTICLNLDTLEIEDLSDADES
jgi:hypothetical protein